MSCIFRITEPIPTDTSIDRYCYVYTQFYLALYMCVFILTGFPCGYF